MKLTTFTAQDGNVFRDGIYQTPEACEALLIRWREAGADNADWFAPFARVLAHDLEAAMGAADLLPEPNERAA